MAASNILGRAATSASYNMVLQLMFRVLTFVLNAFVLRYISKDLLGVVNVRLTLLYSTILFISREAFRRACLTKGSEDRKWTQIVNLVWCIIPLGIISSLVFGYIWSELLEQPDGHVVPHYRIGVVCFAFSAVLDLLAEPLYIVAQILLYVRFKVVAEGIAIAARCMVTVALILIYPQLGVLAFSIAQIIFSLVTLVIHYGYFAYILLRTEKDSEFPFTSVRQFFPRRERPMTCAVLTSLTLSFFKQGFLKQILTEGERYVMTFFGVLSFGDQGIYDVVNNLGSLAARFIFLPLEDSGYLFFSQCLTRGEPATKQDKEHMELSTHVLESLLKVVTLIGLIMVAFGYAYSTLFLDLYGGSMLSTGSGPTLLKAFCIYILLLAVNGITECFANATMSKYQLEKYNVMMVFFSCIFLVSSLILTQYLGSIGFVLANCVNMLARILHNLFHIYRYFEGTSERPLLGIVPSKWVLIILISSFCLTSTSEVLFCCSEGNLFRFLHVVLGAFCGLTLLFTIYMTENKLITFISRQFRAKYDDKAKKE